MMNPHDTKMEDISNVFFAMTRGVANMRYFKAQQITLNHRVEQEIYHTFHDDDDVHMEGDRRDPALRDLQYSPLDHLASERPGVLFSICNKLTFSTFLEVESLS